jgi:hypothetical protein
MTTITKYFNNDRQEVPQYKATMAVALTLDNWGRVIKSATITVNQKKMVEAAEDNRDEKGERQGITNNGAGTDEMH